MEEERRWGRFFFRGGKCRVRSEAGLTTVIIGCEKESQILSIFLGGEV